MRKKSGYLVIAFAFLFFLPTAFAAWVWSPEEGKFVNPDEEVQETPQEQYDYAMEFYKNKDLKQAAHQFRLLLKRYPGSQVAPESQFRLGAIQEELGDYYKAFRAYRDLIQRYPQTERMVEAVEREFRIGNLFLSGSKAKVMGLAVLPSGPRAIEVFKHIVEAAPYGEHGEKAQFHLGLAYKKVNQFDGAIEAFQAVIDKYPKSELLPQARFQIADTSYLQSVVATRDQRVMDRASEEIDRFLTHYPDSNVSDKAAKLRQEIDEKNAEKNFRIALYYEKENFLDSAFIYYRDVSERYPHTLWGKKAISRLEALERPAEFFKSQEAEVSGRKEKLLSVIHAVGGSDPARKRELEEELKRVEKEQKEVQKSKPETIKRRLAALKQKEASLKEKRKALKKKQKRFSKNASEDFLVAFERWQASLDKEEQDLVREKIKIQQWEKSLGVQTEPLYSRVIPFAKEPPSPLEQVQRLEAERLEKIVRERREILVKKEALYHEYEKLLAREGTTSPAGPALDRDREKLDSQLTEIQRLEKNLEEKEGLYKKHFGVPAWQVVLQAPTRVLGRSVDVLNPFDGSPKEGWSSQSADELNVLEKQWSNKIDSQQALVDVITGAFDDELNKSVEKEMQEAPGRKEIDLTTLRKTIKQLEREIRSRYNEIQDRNERKSELLEEVEKILQGKDEKEGTGTSAGKILTAPARGVYLFGRSFLFGLPERDVVLTQEAKRLAPEKAEAALLQELREQIELESLLIETRNREILRFKRELEALKAEFSLAGGRPARSLLVKFPYVFVREAITSANRLVPKKDRKEELIEQLNRETEKLEQLKRERAELRDLIEQKSPRSQKRQRRKTAEPAASPAIQQAAEPRPDQQALQEEIRTLEKQLELEVASFESRHETFEKSRWEKLSSGRRKTQTEKLKGIEKDLVHLIEKEQKIQEEEKSLLAKKKEAVEQFLEKLPSELFTNDLNRERDEIDARLAEIQKRETSLGEELRRFRPQALPSS